MARLPTPGSDAGNWGSILNDYLQVEHNSDGTLRNAARPSDVAAKYTKPGSGIPKTDLDSSTQSTLDKVATHDTDIAAKADQTDLTATNTRVDAVEAAGWVTSARIAPSSITREKLGADVAAALVASRLMAAGDPVYRKAASNAVMASPPTITQGTTATISGQVIDLRSTTKVRWVSGATAASTDGNWIISRPPRKADGSLDAGSPDYYLSLEFMADCAAFELRVLAQTTKILILVDGERHIATQTVTDNSGASRYVKVDFGGRRSDGMARRIQVTLTQGYLRSLAVAATDSVYPIPDGPAPMLAVLGDSYGTGYATRALTNIHDGYPEQLARLLGFRCCAQNCASSTGYIATSAPYGAYASRVADIIALAPDMVLVQGSINDYAATPSALGAAALPVLTALRTGLPKAVIVATGILNASPTPQQGGDAAQSAAITSAAASAGVLYLDTTGWVAGTGKAGATTGDGNADVYTYSDGTHPTVAGGYYLAARLASELRNKVMSLASIL